LKIKSRGEFLIAVALFANVDSEKKPMIFRSNVAEEQICDNFNVG
jgi:hypothetical protein